MHDIQKEIREYLEERNWNNNPPADLAKSISIEAAELLEHFQWNRDDVDTIKQDSERFLKIQKELADVLIYSVQFCDLLGVSHIDVIQNKLDTVKEKYPTELVKNNDAAMLLRKQEYREKGIN